MSALSFKEFGTNVRPAAGSAIDRFAWAKDEEGPGQNNGTRLDAAWVNSLVGMLRYLFTESNVPAEWQDDSLLARAIAAYVNTSLEGQFYTSAEMDDLLAEKVGTDRQILGSGLISGGGDLTADRTLTVVIASQAEAEAGLVNDKAMTPLRTAQAIAALAEGGGGGSGVTAAELAGALYGATSIAAAATCDVLGEDALVVHITGTTGPITSFGAGPDRIRFCKVVGTPTINNTAAILTPTGQPIVCEAGDTFMLESDASSVATIRHFQRKSGAPLALTSGLITGALGFTPASNARSISTTGLLTGGGNLSADRTFDVPVASQGEAEAGTNNTKAMTALRVAQAIANLAVASFNGRVGAISLTSSDIATALGFTPATAARSIGTSGLASGGGDLTANRTITVPIPPDAGSAIGANHSYAMTPAWVQYAIANTSPARAISNALGSPIDGGPGFLVDVNLSLSGGTLTLTKHRAIPGTGGGGGGG